MALSSDIVNIFQPWEAQNPCFKIQLRKLSDRNTVHLYVGDENDRFERSASVSFYVTMTIEQLLEIFPTAEVIETIDD